MIGRPSSRAMLALAGGTFVVAMVVPDAVFAAPSAIRWMWALLVATLVAVVLARPRLLARIRTALSHPWTARAVLGLWLACGLTAQVLKVRALADVHGQDQAYHVQVLWNTLQGRFAQGSALQELYFDPPLRNHMGLHVSPAFLALTPLFAIAPHVGTLLAVKVLAAALGAFVLLKIAGSALDRASATLVMTAYLLHPTVLGQWTHDFYPAVLAGPALLAAFYAWETRRLGWFALALIGLLSVREDLGLTAVAFAGIALLERGARRTDFRGWRWATVPAALGVAWYVVATRLVMPLGGGHGVAGNVAEWYGGFGDTPGEIVRNIVTDPVHALTVAFASAKVLYLWQMLRPFAALPLLGRASVVAIPALAVNVLVTVAGPTTDPNGHYSVVVAAALAVAAVLALRSIRTSRGAGAGFALAIVMCGAGLTAVPDTVNATTLGRLRRPAHAVLVDAALAEVPPHADVAAPSDYLSLLACAPRVYAVNRFGHYPPDLGRPDVVILDTDPERIHVVPERHARYAARIAAFLADADYERAFDRDGLVVLRRRSVRIAGSD